MRRAEAGVRAAAAGDQDLIAGGSALHVPAEVVAEHVRGDRDWLRLGRRVGGVELVGLEPTASSLPATRSAQLSYSPGKFVLLRKVNARMLVIPRRAHPQLDRPPV